MRAIPITELYLGPRKTVLASDELIVGIRIPKRPGVHGAFLRLGQRQAQAISKVSVAVAMTFKDGRPDWVRVALGSVAPTVIRAPATEKALMGGGYAALKGALDAVRDESSKEAAVRLVFEPKTSRIPQDELLNTLLAHTSLESSTPINLTMVGADGRPTQKSLRQLLVEWIGFRLATVERRSRHRLAKVAERIHILEGRQLVLLNIDEVIRIIRASDEPKPAHPAALQAINPDFAVAVERLITRLRANDCGDDASCP
jgi:hypothetical protein